MEEFYKLWMSGLNKLLDGYTYTSKGGLNPARDEYENLVSTLNRFVEGELSENEKIILLTGLRGTGKTTLLAQLYSIALKNNLRTIYIDAGRLNLESFSLNDFLIFWQKDAEFEIEDPKRKTLMLIDEVHYDEKWGLFLKTIFDRVKGNEEFMVIATGSSALKIKMNADLGRRVIFKEILPLKFSEFTRISGIPKTEKPLFSPSLSEVVFNSLDAVTALSGIKQKIQEADRYLLKLQPSVFSDYFIVGGLPFFKNINERSLIKSAVKSVVEGVIARDIVSLKRFKSQALSKLYSLVCLLAESDVATLEKLGTSLALENYRTIYSLVESLVYSGLVYSVKSYGRRHHSVRKTPKLFFAHPFFRDAVLDGAVPGRVQGKKYEEIFVLAYRNYFSADSGAEIYYDSAEGGADFIVKREDNTKITVEISSSKEELSQVISTMKKTDSKYGILFGSKQLELVEKNIIKIPIKYLFMI